ncbi:MAG TPA: LiaF-related protein, partial [Rectinema sp.]|nr:LiaF-related protein [Rectinema sp.]
MPDLEKYDHGPTKIERNNVIERLEHSFAQNLLDIDVYEKRMEIAVNTASKRELLSLIEDLPVPTETNKQSSSFDRILLNLGEIKDYDVTLALLSGATRKGLWYPPKRMKVVAIMGGVDLDYSQAQIPPGVSNIDIFALMGGVNIFVPEGVNVEVTGIPIMGGIDNRAASSGKLGAPTIKVNAITLMGGLDIKVK